MEIKGSRRELLWMTLSYLNQVRNFIVGKRLILLKSKTFLPESRYLEIKEYIFMHDKSPPLSLKWQSKLNQGNPPRVYSIR
jgi:hypothetical protein